MISFGMINEHIGDLADAMSMLHVAEDEDEEVDEDEDEDSYV